MMKKMKKIKEFIKKNSGPPNDGNYKGTSQLMQYAARSQIAEDSKFRQFLRSRGIETTKKLSQSDIVMHSNSKAYNTWKNNHANEDLTTGRKSGTDIRSKTEHSPTELRARLIKKAYSHYAVKPVTSGMREEVDQKDIDKFHLKLDKLVHTTFGKSKTEKRMKKEEVKEGTFADNKAATQTVMGPGELGEKKKKTLSSFKKTIKEDMYDHEKEDKSVKTYGKKPKFDKAEKDEGGSEKKPTAAAEFQYGRTFTGSEGDMIEIDPMMRNRPGQPDITKKDEKKKEEKSEKKQDKK